MDFHLFVAHLFVHSTLPFCVRAGLETRPTKRHTRSLLTQYPCKQSTRQMHAVFCLLKDDAL